jgi:hypothetical protein
MTHALHLQATSSFSVAWHGQLYRTDETKLSTTDYVSQYHEKKFAAC